MFSCTSHSKTFRKRPFQAMTFNASATNNSGLEQATVVVPSKFVVEWSNHRYITYYVPELETESRERINPIHFRRSPSVQRCMVCRLVLIWMQKRPTTGSEAIVWKVDDYYQEYTA